MQTKLFEIFVPTKWIDVFGVERNCKTKHHKEWGKKVIALTGGLTVCSPGKGKWVDDGVDYFEKVIPVRIMCSDEVFDKIVDMTITHYQQKAVMYYVVTEKVEVRYAKPKSKP